VAEDLDLPIDNPVPKIYDPQCLAHSPVLLSPVSLPVDMSISLRNREEVNIYIQLTLNHSLADTIVVLQVVLGSVICHFWDVQYPIPPALPVVQHALQSLFRI
jgi:hypothetical protein